jgi:adenylate cyclase
MREDEEATIRTLKTYRKEMRNLIQRYRGRVVDSPGDNIMAEFASVVDALNCAVEIQRELAERNTELTPDRRMQFRIGVNLGDVVEDGERIYGDGVNIAARMESLAEGGGICISGIVYDQVKHKLGLEYEYQGEQEVKNIAEPVPAYRVLSFPGAAAHRVVKAKRAVGRTWRNVAVAIVAVLVVAAAVAVWKFYFRPPSIEPASVDRMAFPLPDKPSIAILPFVNISEDPKQEYLADGISENIISALSKVPKSVQRSGDSLRITAQLIDTISGHHLWSESYDRDLKDIFALQDEITMKIINALRVELTEGEEARLWGKGTTNLKAFLKAIRARDLTHQQTREGNILARRMAEEAIALDSEFPPSYHVLAVTHMMDVWFRTTKSPKQSLKRALELTQKAIALDDSFATAHGFLGFLYTTLRQYDKGIAEGERAVALDPNGAWSHYYLGFALRNADRCGEAVQVIEKSIRLNPFPPGLYFRQACAVYNCTERYEEAIAAAKKAVTIAPNDFMSHGCLAAAYSLAGREEEARSAAEEVLRINPKYSLEYIARMAPYKNKRELERRLNALRKAGLPETPPLPLPDKPSIAVLPFVNMSGDPEQEYLSDGISEGIITGLSKTPKLFVIARNSTFTYKGKPVKVQQVRHELGVRYVLEGSVQRYVDYGVDPDKSGPMPMQKVDSLRITAQLVDAKTGYQIWAERYDRELKDIFALQDEITMKIVAAMQLKLTEGETARLHAKGTDNLEAYTKWLQAHFYFIQYTPDDNVRARELAEQAIALEPNYAAAYSLLALTHVHDVFYGTTKDAKERIRQSIKLAQKALSIDDSDPLSYVALGRIYTVTKQYEKAIINFNQALTLNPNLVEANRYLGLNLVLAGRPQKALPFIKKALRLNPVEKGRTMALGSAYQRLGRYEEAIDALEEVVRFRPKHFFAHFVLAFCYVALDREEAARAEVAEAFRINPNYSIEESKKRWAKSGPSSDPVLQERFFDLMRNAGFK